MSDNDREIARGEFKRLSSKKKLLHIWEYYRFYMMAAVALIIVATSLVNQYVIQKKVVMNAIIGNAEVLDATYLQNDFNEYAQIDIKKYTCNIKTDFRITSDKDSNGNMVNEVQFMTMANAGLMDAAVFDSAMFYYYAVNGFWGDLRVFYTEEELEKFDGKLYYLEKEDMNGTIGEELVAEAEVSDSRKEYREMIAEDAKRHRDPSNFKEPIPVGIYVEDATLITSSDCYKNQIPVMGILNNTKEAVNAQKFVQYVLTQEYQPGI